MGAAKNPARPAEACEADPSAKALAGMSVLIIEDEPLIAMSLELELQDAGAEVDKIASCSSSTRSVIDEGNSFDAAVVDLRVANSDTSALARLLTSDADKRITEDNQKGVNSRFYQPGPYALVEANLMCWIDWHLGEVA